MNAKESDVTDVTQTVSLREQRKLAAYVSTYPKN
jgi:hypothetical protein